MMMTIIEPFNKLVKLVATAFYETYHEPPKTSQAADDDRGLTVVVLGALSRRQWAREEDLAGELKLPPRKFRSTLHFLEKEKLVAGDQREGTTYFCPAYAQMYDVVWYMLHSTRKKWKDELVKDDNVEEYVCPSPHYGKRYSSLDALYLMSMEDDGSCFDCESCNGELVVASDRDARLRRGQELKDRLQSIEVQMKPVTEQLDKVKDLAFPEFGSLQDLEASGRPMYIKSVEVEVEFCWVEGQSEEALGHQICVMSKRDEDPEEDNVS